MRKSIAKPFERSKSDSEKGMREGSKKDMALDHKQMMPHKMPHKGKGK